jgi:putative FmdB family regulatory protein
MPTYQYACTSCGERLEVVQKFSDDPLTVCPACSGALRKVFSPVGVVFKGSGFYKTDSRGNGAKSDSPGKAETKSTESTSSDSTSTSKKAETTSSSTTSTPAA